MNYRRIELIFLVAFMCINAYLISVWYDATKDKVVSNTKVETNIVKVLKEENIKYHFDISDKTSEGTYLSAEIGDLFTDVSKLSNQSITNNQGILVSSLENPIVVDYDNEIEELNKFKNDLHLMQYGKEYKYLKEASQSNKVICYAQYFKDLPIFDESAETVFIKEKAKDKTDKIIGYKQQYLKNLQVIRDEQTLISQKQALSTLYNNSKLDTGMTINWMKLGYSKIYNEDKINIYVPTWLVSVKNSNGVSQIEKVNAIMNKVMSGTSVDVIN